MYLDSSSSPQLGSTTQSIQLDQTPNQELIQAEQMGKIQIQVSAKAKQPIQVTQPNQATTKPLHTEKPNSPASSLIHKAPPSSPQADTKSDVNEEDIKALNKIL